MGLKESFLNSARTEKLVSGPVGDVLVRSITIGGKDRIQAAVMGERSYRTIVIRECLFDPKTKKPVFASDDDVDAIPAHTIEPYIDEAMTLSAFSPTEVEELEGNSERTPNSDTE